MPADVSVVMGCFNSRKTLHEALDSVLSQEFPGALELIAVDDGSRDSTLSILKQRASRDSRLRVLTHGENRGGGAARNTAIRAATGRFVLDFDSDNILGPGAVKIMSDFLAANRNLNGVLFEEQRIFHGNNRRRYEPFRYYTESSPLELNAVFQGKKAQFGNLMCRRETYELVGGYPEHHGFDTQGFCMRFLSRGLRAQVAPGSYYWHRTNNSQPSYFERVFASGRHNLNTYLVYEDMIECFSDAAISVIIDSPIFRVAGFEPEALDPRLSRLEKAGTAILRHKGDAPRHPDASTFVNGVLAMRRQEYGEAIHDFLRLAAKGLSTPILVFNIIRCTLGIAGAVPAQLIEETLQVVEQLTTRKFPVSRRWSILDRGLVKAARCVLASHGIKDPLA